MTSSQSDLVVVLGAGLPRTGTASTRAALSTLLGGKCYHMYFVAQGDIVDKRLWTRAMRNEATTEDFRATFHQRGFRSGVDYPVALFLRELMQAYPDAKIVMTHRNPASWYKSVRDSIHDLQKNVFSNAVVRLFLRMVGKLDTVDLIRALSYHTHHPLGQSKTKKGMFGVIEAGEDAAVAFYQAWTQEVRRLVPKDKLLEFEVREGWEPLCNFLNLPQPTRPFPKINDTAQVKRVGKAIKVAAHLLIIGLPGALAALLALNFNRDLFANVGNF